MPINTNLDVAPYYDDFNANNEYYRILFRPSTAVQARELTQIQSILQNQIENFGNWAFKNGNIVSGCAIHDDPNVPFVRLQDYQSNGASYDATSFANLQVVSAVSNLTATIIVSNSGLTANYPNTNVIYLRYINTGNNGAKVFSNNEILNFYVNPRTGNNVADIVAIVNTYANSTSGQLTTGAAHGIHVDAGVVFLNGVFVNVLQPTYGLVNNFGTYAGNNVVGFQLTESIVTENQDSSLLDNALGYPNENAPGAHRLKLLPTLVSLDTSNSSTNTSGFNPIVTYNYGAISTTSVAGQNLYSILNDSIAKRTYETSGNYVVNPFVVDTTTNGPSALTPDLVYGRVNPGVGYAEGYRVELQKTQYITMRRGNDTNSKLEQQITFNYGSYFLLDEVAGDFGFNTAGTISLYDTPQFSVTKRLFASATPVGNVIGTAQVRCFSYNDGKTQGSNTALYALHVFNINMNSGNGYNLSQVQSVYYNAGGIKGIGDVVGSGINNASTKDQLFSFGDVGLQSLRDSSNNLHSEYTYRTRVSTQMNTVGDSTITLPSSAAGGIDILPYGTGVLTDLNAANFTLIVTGANTDTANFSGTVSVNATSNVVTGTSTSFIINFNIGDQIKVNQGTATDVRTVTSIVNTTSLSVDNPFSTTNGTATYAKTYITGKIIPINQYPAAYGGPSSYIQVTNTTSFSVNTLEAPSTPVNVDVVFDVLRTFATPAKKVINKNRFVKLDTSLNPNGPWCLGFSDIHQVSLVTGSSTASYSLTNQDITSNFVFDTGQKDTIYSLGYLYPAAGYNTSANPYLLVQLDYFTTNTASGTGFYSVESYPVNDGLPGFVTVSSGSTAVVGNNTTFTSSFIVGDLIEIDSTFRTVASIANSTYMTINTPFNNSYTNVSYYNATTIQTKDIPLYVDEGGKKISLRDYVDFRLPANSNATDTGKCDTSNSAQLTAAIGAASTNPSNTVAYNVYTTLNVPSYGKNFQSDYTYYLPRKDLIMMTSDNVIKIKEGHPSDSPQTPLYPDNAMVLATINVPPYPSLSSDQLDTLLSINQLSKNLTRDNSHGISINLVSNRRYTMKDIGKLDSRITNLEYYQALSLLEKKATDMNVTDSNGLNRFKNGIFVDAFNDFTQSDVTNPEYSIAIDTTSGFARPRIVREIVNIQFNGGISSAQQTGRAVSLPYTEVAFMAQPFATKYRSSAHVSMAWNGTCLAIPAYDNHVDTNNTGSINITVDLSTPWKDFAQSPFGSIWNDWATTTSTTTNTVVTNSGAPISNVNLGFIGKFTGGGGGQNPTTEKEAETAALALIHAKYGNNVTIGALSLKHGSDAPVVIAPPF